MLRRLVLALHFFILGSSLALAVDVSTATGKRMDFDNTAGTVLIEGDAVLQSSTATIKADVIRANMKTKEAIAKGHVVVEQSSGTLTGSEAEYDWGTSTGVILNAQGVSPPWSFTSDRLVQVGPGLFQLRNGDFTSCTEDPPHYHLAASRGNIIVGKRARLKNVSMVADQSPIFWTPFYTRSLKPKKYTLRIEPGQTGRDGFTNKTIIGYPFTTNSRTRLRWDFLERTGNGVGLQHDYNAPTVSGSFDSYYIRDINPDPIPQSRRYSALWNHYQKITSRLTMNARFDLKSDRTFGNQFEGVGNEIRVESVVRGMFSEGGLNYQFSKAALQAQFDRRDTFNVQVSSSRFISKLTLPRLSLTTIPLKFKHVPFYTNFTGTYINETLTRIDPEQTLRYQRSGSFGSQIRKDFKVNRDLTVTPSAGYSEFWQDRDLNIVDSEKDVYFGRSTLGTNVRRRFGRSTNMNLNYTYGTRTRRNNLRVDSGANDFGIETNQLNTSVERRVGFFNRVTLTSGYDFREPPRNAPRKYEHLSERISAPSLDVHWELNRNVAVNFRETYGLFNPQIANSVRTPVNTSGEIQFGQISKNTFFSQGYSYAKQFGSETTQVIFTNKLKFYMTPKWFVDCFLSYRAVGDKSLDYSKVYPIERTLQVVRDMHCWVLRMKFSKRPEVSEVSFFIDLKANLSDERNLFASQRDESFYKSRDEKLDISNIFPETKP